MVWLVKRFFSGLVMIIIAIGVASAATLGFDDLVKTHPDKESLYTAGFLLAAFLCGCLALYGAAKIYFLPSAAAMRYRHQYVQAIVILNFLLGWTLIGWVLALVWAMTAAGLADLADPPAPALSPDGAPPVPAQPESPSDEDLIGNRLLRRLGLTLAALFLGALPPK